MLPLGEDRHIEHLEYLPADLVPETPLMKYSIVDVRCRDNYGRQFIVEMQLAWTTGFMQRVLFNASKAYVKQLDKAFVYKALQPVYALSLVNEIFEPDTPEFYHHYQIVNIADTEKQLEGLEFVFVELPKFKAAKFSEKKLQVLWLRFLTEIDEHSTHIPEELLRNSEISEALENVRVSAFTKAELDTYDRYWDRVRVELTFKDEYYTKGLKEGEEKGEAIGEARGEAIGEARGEAIRNIAVTKNAIVAGMDNEIIKTLTGLTDKQIDALRTEIKNKK